MDGGLPGAPAMSDEQAKWHKTLLEKIKGVRSDVKKEYKSSAPSDQVSPFPRLPLLLLLIS